MFKGHVERLRLIASIACKKFDDLDHYGEVNGGGADYLQRLLIQSRTLVKCHQELIYALEGELSKYNEGLVR